MPYRFERSVSIKASPETVWTIAQEPERRLEWDVRVTAVELLTPRPMGKGARLHVSYNMFGFPMEVEMEMVSWQPHQRSGVKGVVRDAGDTIGASWNFAQGPDGATTWTTRVVLTSHGRLARVREWVFGASTELLTVISQRRLKALAEAEERTRAEAATPEARPASNQS
jgi:hypothetical protein